MAGAVPLQSAEEASLPMHRPRLIAPDLLRGLLMAMMAVDHASYFIAKVHRSEFWGLPLPKYDSAAWFATRFVTHFCAPGFFLLMGLGMALFAASRSRMGWRHGRIVRHFAVRGLLLIGLQLVVEDPAWLLGEVGGGLNLTPPPGAAGRPTLLLHFGVLYALGAAMVLWAALLRVPKWILLAVSAAAMLATQVVVPGPGSASVAYWPPLRLLVMPGRTGIWQVYYPALPWFGIVGVGVALGRLLGTAPKRAALTAGACGAALLGLFFLARWVGGFGNFHPPGEGVIGFLNVTKYPPSLSFCLLTVGGNLLALAALAAAGHRVEQWAGPVLALGRAALFFYIAHLLVYGLIGLAFPRGAGLAATYAVWLVGLLVLYPACRRYGAFKRGRPADSIWRLF